MHFITRYQNWRRVIVFLDKPNEYDKIFAKCTETKKDNKEVEQWLKKIIPTRCWIF